MLPIVRLIGKAILYFIILLLVLVGLLINPIDRQPWQHHEAYLNTFQTIETLDFSVQSPKNTLLEVGWAKVNITPKNPTKLVGFKPRGPYEAVRDSLFVRVMVFRNGAQTVCIVSYDLLLPPPILADVLRQTVAEQFPNTFLYFSATHTHTGFGGWDVQPASRFITGSFNEPLFNQLKKLSLSAIGKAMDTMAPASIGFTKIDASDWIENRLDKGGAVDGWLRVVKVEKHNGETAALASYGAHATSISSKILHLSRDYPGVLVDALEQRTTDFAIFCAGMVGSHRPENHGLQAFTLADSLGNVLARRIHEHFGQIPLQPNNPMVYHHIPIELPKPQLRLTKHLAVRPWFFERMLGELEATLTYFRLGDIVFIGTPCDFSGELSLEGRFDKFATQRNLQLLITSFNGDYVGYIVPDRYYDTKRREEVRTMQWVGPNKGAYFTALIHKLLLQ